MFRHTTNQRLLTIALSALVLAGCPSEQNPGSPSESPGEFDLVGFVDNPDLDEISGIETAVRGDFYVHNDEGKPLFHVLNQLGRYQSSIELKGAQNRDWEDITIVTDAGQRWLVAGDIGDNQARYKTISLYFAREPVADEAGNYPADVELEHRIKLKYPDGPRDCEAMAWDSASRQILFMTKRDKVPRLYGLPLETALSEKSAELVFLAEVPTFSPPTAIEKLSSGKRALWLSQPTGMDISDDGLLATVITYRSLYVFERQPGETWAEAFQNKPREFHGPPGIYEEAVTVDEMKTRIHVVGEKVPTPFYRLDLR